MPETFESCKDKIGRQFFIEPRVERASWFPEQSFTLLRFTEPYLTFYKKRGTSEVRYDLKKEDLLFYKIIPANA